MGRVRQWFTEHPPSSWVLLLEGILRLLNILLLLLGLAVLALSIVTVVQIQNEPNTPQPPPAPAPTPEPVPSSPQPAVLPAGHSTTAAAAFRSAAILNVPWFIYVFGLLGAATALCAVVALVGVRLRNLGCVNSHIFFTCLLLTGQACAAVAFFVDAGWEHRLPDIDEKLKKFLMERLEVCKWVGVGLAALQLLTLLLSCSLQSAYVRAEEAAEDADEEAAWRRRPLLAAQQARMSPSPAAGTSAAAAGAAADDGWSERMQQQYGLDTSQFGYRPGRGSAAGLTAGQNQAASRQRCVIM